MGHQHAAARHGVVEADARSPRYGTGDRGSTSDVARVRADRRNQRGIRLRQTISRIAIRGAIEFRDLVFSFGDTRRFSNHVSATIEAGQTVALVGVTGSGKSTLISLLARLHDPPRGSVFIDGRRRPRHPAGDAPTLHRVRSAGAVPVLGHAGGQHRVRSGRAHGRSLDRTARRTNRAPRILRTRRQSVSSV